MTSPHVQETDEGDGSGNQPAQLGTPRAAPPRVSVVVPALNEARNLPYLLTRLPRGLHQVIVVDGHSTDNTVEVARGLCPDVEIIYQDGWGKGNALACGFSACTGDIIVTLDADGSTDAAEIPRFVAALLHGADFAKGTRFAAGGGSADITIVRRMGNRVLTGVVNTLYGTRYTDLCYGYNAFWRHCLPSIDIDCDGFEVETLIHVRLAGSGLSVHEVPSYEQSRVHGLSNLRAVRDGVRVLKTIAAEWPRPLSADTPVLPKGYGWDGIERRRQAATPDDGRLGRRAADRTVLEGRPMGRQTPTADAPDAAAASGSAAGGGSRHLPEIRDEGAGALRIMVVGAGTHFLSGVSVYTYHLTNALAPTNRVSALLIRRMLPTFLYPGRARVGDDLARLTFDRSVRAFDGVDWYWIPSMLRAIAFLLRERPDAVIFQWWTGTVVHSYVLLAAVARLLGADVVVEFHEVQDTGELRLAPARAYVRAIAPVFMRLVSAVAVHTEDDQSLVAEHYPVGERPVVVLPHGPYDHYQDADSCLPVRREAPEDCCNLLFFGVIRPYKGLEDLIQAFNTIPPAEIAGFWLTVVGETWEKWCLPGELIAQSPHRDRITFVNRYVDDAEVDGYFRGADAVVLPYRRSRLSGPLHVAMGYGLPVVATDVGGLPESARGYEGAMLVPPGDVKALYRALFAVRDRRGHRYAHPHQWSQTGEVYSRFLARHGRGRAHNMSLRPDAAH